MKTIYVILCLVFITNGFSKTITRAGSASGVQSDNQTQNEVEDNLYKTVMKEVVKQVGGTYIKSTISINKSEDSESVSQEFFSVVIGVAKLVSGTKIVKKYTDTITQITTISLRAEFEFDEEEIKDELDKMRIKQDLEDEKKIEKRVVAEVTRKLERMREYNDYMAQVAQEQEDIKDREKELLKRKKEEWNREKKREKERMRELQNMTGDLSNDNNSFIKSEEEKDTPWDFFKIVIGIPLTIVVVSWLVSEHSWNR